MTGTKLFQRNRALGYVSNHIPASIRYIRKRKENVIVTCVGRAFHTYGCNQFRLICISGLHPDEITCIAADNLHVYSASDKNVYAWRSGNVIKHVYKGHTRNVHLILPFSKHLITIDEGNILKIWDVNTEEIYLDLPFQKDNFNITAILHPATYINKILLGSSQGILQLWNVKECKLVHTFTPIEGHIMVLEQAPAIDVAAVGMADGKIILINLKYDEILMQFSQDWGSVSGISFRTDGHPIMATSSTNGKIVFWNLEEKRIVSHLRAHTKSVTTTFCLPNEPLLLTTSPDNSMKLWIFDTLDGGARLLKIREGHTKPPTSIRFHGANGQNILSSGEDSTLRIFNTVVDHLNRSLGTASFNRKASKKLNRFQKDTHRMPPISKFTSETTRDKEWDSIAAIHNGLLQTTTWSYHNSKMGDLKLVPEKYHKKNKQNFKVDATCLCLTYCGNFVIIGYSSGDVVRFNIQSGIERAVYGNPAHLKTAIRGVGSDNLNQIVISGCSDGLVKFWKFKVINSEPLATIRMDSGIILFETHRESSMICVALDDFSVALIDCDTKTIIRRFIGHTAQITDVCFSPDSRWLITAGIDCTIKVWDIPSSYLIDHFKVENPCTSVSMSPTGQFLATSHVNFVGVYLWANKTLYNHISLRAINPYSEAPFIDLHESMITDMIETGENDFKLDEGEEIESNYTTPAQLDSILITMSPFAASKWQNLLNLDIIKKRNKPKAPPKKPKQAPFFLPTLSGQEIQFDFSNTNKDENSKILSSNQTESLGTFGKMLKATATTNNYQSCIDYLINLGPSMLDVEIKLLSIDNGGSILLMEQFIKLIIKMFELNLYFELAQAYLCVFLKSHSTEISKTKKLSDYLEDIEKSQNNCWHNLENKLLYGIGVVSTLRNFVT